LAQSASLPGAQCRNAVWLGPLSEAIEVLFGNAQLAQDLMEQPAPNLGVAVNGYRGAAAVGMFPARVAALLPHLAEAEPAPPRAPFLAL